MATHLSHAMQQTGFTLVQVYNRSEEAAKTLANSLHCRHTTQIQDITTEADVYILSIKDDALAQCIEQLPMGSGLYLHTAGSVSIEVFTPKTARCGVLYPVQTFSKERNLNFSSIPICIETANPADTDLLEQIAQRLSKKVVHLSSEKRKHLHLAAVFACNFSNHMYTLAAEIAEDAGVDWSLLQPLIKETAAKVENMPPLEAQTGPAVRYDRKVIKKQVDLLATPSLKKMYRLLSLSIKKYAGLEP